MTKAIPLPISIDDAINDLRLLIALSFIIKPVKGGNPPLLTKDRLKFLELVFINMIVGSKTIKYILKNHHIKKGFKAKIQPTWTIPEKMITMIGSLILIIKNAPNQIFNIVKNPLLRTQNTNKEMGAIFCQD